MHGQREWERAKQSGNYNMQTHAKCIGIDVPKPKQSIQIYYEHRYLFMPNALILSQNVFGRDLSFTLHLFDMANRIEKKEEKNQFLAWIVTTLCIYVCECVCVFIIISNGLFLFHEREPNGVRNVHRMEMGKSGGIGRFFLFSPIHCCWNYCCCCRHHHFISFHIAVVVVFHKCMSVYCLCVLECSFATVSNGSNLLFALSLFVKSNLQFKSHV